MLAEEDTQAPPAASASRALDAIPSNTPIKNLPVLPARLPPDWLPPDAFDLDAPGEVMAIRPGGEWYFTRCVPAEAVYPPPQPQQGR